MCPVLYPFGPEREIKGESGSDTALPKGDHLGLRIILGLTRERQAIEVGGVNANLVNH